MEPIGRSFPDDDKLRYFIYLILLVNLSAELICTNSPQRVIANI